MEIFQNVLCLISMDIKGHVAVITGAGSGFGRAIAGVLAGEGCQLVLVGRRKEKLEESAAELEDSVPVSIFTKDISASFDVEELAMEVLREHKKVHILVNNAGFFPENAPIEKMEVLDWDTTLATNLRGPFLLMRAFLPSMIENDYGRILNISAPIKHYPGAAAYCASKSALDSLTKAVAFENKQRNILVNAVEPPFMDTEMHTGGADPCVIAREVLPYFDPDEEKMRGRVNKIEKSE